MIEIPFSEPGGSYTGNGTIYWGDGSTDILNNANKFHTYAIPGVYQISIIANNGNLPNMDFGSNTNGNDRLKYLSIDEWGGFAPGDVDNFTGCYNLKLDNVIGVPTLQGQGLTDLKLFHFAFSGQTTINNIGNWNVTQVQNMDKFLQYFGDSTGRLTTNNYNQLLIGWASYGASLQNNVFLAAGNSTYSGTAATNAWNYLTGTKNWTIDDGGPV
jgi:hypothetical protein